MGGTYPSEWGEDIVKSSLAAYAAKELFFYNIFSPQKAAKTENITKPI